MQSSDRPEGRCEDLVIQDVSDEVLIYDVKTKRAHHLNSTAAFVWKCCDGKSSILDIRKKYEQKTQERVSEDIIWLAIEQLSGRDLLVDPVAVSFKGQSRREALKRISIAAAVILPIVASLKVPVAAQSASSCLSPACTCTLVANCTNVGGCPCSQQSTCPSLCTQGCSCLVANGTSSCNSTCQD